MARFGESLISSQFSEDLFMFSSLIRQMFKQISAFH